MAVGRSLCSSLGSRGRIGRTTGYRERGRLGATIASRARNALVDGGHRPSEFVLIAPTKLAKTLPDTAEQVLGHMVGFS